MKRHVEVFKASNGWYFRSVAGNGNKGERSTQSYGRRDSARRGARRAHPDDPIVSK